MKFKLLRSVLLVLALCGVLVLAVAAQGMRGGYGNPAGMGGCQMGLGGGGNQTPVPHAAPVYTTVSGTVTAVNTSQDRPVSSISLKDKDGKVYNIQVGPLRYLDEKKFTLSLQDSLVAVVFPGFRDSNLWAAKVITNKTTGQAITLRDEDGVPLWVGAYGMGMRGGRGMRRQGSCQGQPGSCNGTPAVDLTAIKEYGGTVENTAYGYGTGAPTLTVKVAMVNGKALVTPASMAFRLGPYRLLEEKKFQAKAGDAVTIKAAPGTSSTDYLVVFEVGIGNTVWVIRDVKTGLPVW